MPSKHIPIVNVWYQEWEDIFNLLFSGLSYVYVNQPKGRTLLFFLNLGNVSRVFQQTDQRTASVGLCVLTVWLLFFFFLDSETEKAQAIWQKQAQLENNSV